MQVNTVELSGPALDWAVSKVEGFKDINPLTTDGQRRLRTHNYSSNWAKTGPLLERAMQEGMSVNYYPDERQYQAIQRPVGSWSSVECSAYGPTLLVAALRCYVISKMGVKIEVPDSLVEMAV